MEFWKIPSLHRKSHYHSQLRDEVVDAAATREISRSNKRPTKRRWRLWVINKRPTESRKMVRKSIQLYPLTQVAISQPHEAWKRRSHGKAAKSVALACKQIVSHVGPLSTCFSILSRYVPPVLTLKKREPCDGEHSLNFFFATCSTFFDIDEGQLMCVC